MTDSQYNQSLARQFMLGALRVHPGETIWVEYQGPKAKALAEACAAEVTGAGAKAHVVDSGATVLNAEIGGRTADAIAAQGANMLRAMRGMQGYIRIKDDADQSHVTLTADEMQWYKAATRAMTEYRVNNTRWLVVAAPTEEFAASFEMEYPAFLEFYADVCLTDYGKMGAAVEPLQKLMTAGKSVRIVSPAQETDLAFSIEGINAVPCTGRHNIPDGECFTAPVRDSVNGTIKFGPSKYDGQSFQFIRLTFRHGRIEHAEAESAERTERLNHMLDADEGARYVGEFSLNFNPYIKHPVGNILFDEKIDGGIHMAMGNCYDEAFNGNKSSVHWDMVHIQRPDYGGGEVWIDDRLIRKDGLFILPELEALNPENLKAATKR